MFLKIHFKFTYSNSLGDIPHISKIENATKDANTNNPTGIWVIACKNHEMLHFCFINVCSQMPQLDQSNACAALNSVLITMCCKVHATMKAILPPRKRVLAHGMNQLHILQCTAREPNITLLHVFEMNRNHPIISCHSSRWQPLLVVLAPAPWLSTSMCSSFGTETTLSYL